MNPLDRRQVMSKHYQLLRRAGWLFARFFGAAANFGLTAALRLYVFDFLRKADSSVWHPQLDRKVHFRGKSDYEAMTLLFKEDFQIEPINWQVRTVLDLGANIGIEALRFAVFYPEAKIIAVEADEDNYCVLRKNTTGLELVNALHSAAWGTKARFRVKKHTSSNLASVVSANPDGDVPGVTIPELIEQLGVRELDVLKIDIEGAEDSLFGPTIAEWIGRVRVIVWELSDHEAPGCLARLVASMAKAGVSFNFHICGEKLVCVRSDTLVAVHQPCGLLSLA
jgi:FkbM family methyltransferase